MILFCQRQRELINVREQLTDYWAFTSCYQSFEEMMRERDPDWSVSPGQCFVIELSAKDISEYFGDEIRQMKRLTINHVKEVRQMAGTGTGGTKLRHMIYVGLALLPAGFLGASLTNSHWPVTVAIGGMALEGCVAFWAYGKGKASYNEHVAKREG